AKIAFALPRPHRGQRGNREPNRAPKADRQKQHHDERYSWGEPRDRIFCRCIWVKSPRMTAPGNTGVVRWWHYIVAHGSVLSLFWARECRRPDHVKSGVNHDTTNR